MATALGIGSYGGSRYGLGYYHATFDDGGEGDLYLGRNSARHSVAGDCWIYDRATQRGASDGCYIISCAGGPKWGLQEIDGLGWWASASSLTAEVASSEGI